MIVLDVGCVEQVTFNGASSLAGCNYGKSNRLFVALEDLR